jgi:hypothetical protein
VTIVHTLDKVNILNQSAHNLIINDMSPADLDGLPMPTIDINVDQVSYEFDIEHSFGPTVITISNTNSSGPGLFLNGLIDNPLGYTSILNASGGIFSLGPQAIVRSNRTDLKAGTSIGQETPSDRPVTVEMVRSPGRLTDLKVDAGVNAYLALRGLLRDPDMTDFTVTTGDMVVGNDLTIRLLDAYRQTDVPMTFDYKLIVDMFAPTTAVDLPADEYVRYFRPDEGSLVVDMPVGYFSEGTTLINATYSFRKLDAGNDIDIHSTSPVSRISIIGRNTITASP